MSDPEMNDASTDNAARIDMPHQQSPGARLAAYRKERGWTVEQVANQLNLAPRQIAAIESDDYASLPGMPIVRGFVRAYAKLMKVDSAPLLAALGGETILDQAALAPRKSLSTPFSEARLPSMTDRPGLSSKWIVGLLLVALLAVAIWAAQQSADVTNLQKSAATQVKDGLAYLYGPDSKQQSNAPAKTEKANPVEVTPPPAPAVATAEPAPPSNAPSPAVPVAAAPAVEPSAVPGAAPAAEAAAPAVKNALVLKAREESWVEVRGAANKRSMLARLMKAGEIETIEITEPVSLVIGNAAGVDATLRGEPLEIKAGSGNVARLNLK